LQRRQDRQKEEVELQPVVQQEQFESMRRTIETVYIEPDLEKYIVQLVAETRRDRRVAVGASPRASLALLKLSRAQAALRGRDFVLPDDIKSFVYPVLVHRLLLQPEYWMKQQVVGDVIETVQKNVAVPVRTERS
jgi:MoxR-like ATPase